MWSGSRTFEAGTPTGRPLPAVAQPTAVIPPRPVPGAGQPAGGRAGASEPAASCVALYATVLDAPSLDAAAHALVAALVADFDCTDASIAAHVDGRTRVLASTNPSAGRPGSELASGLLGAMNEAIEQAVSLAWPPTPSAAPDPSIAAAVLPNEPIRIEHRALQRLTGQAVATVPLGRRGEVVCAVTLERDPSRPFSADDLQRIEQVLGLAVPALHWMQRGGEPWSRRMRRDLVQAWARLRHPDHHSLRRLIAGAMLGTAFLALVPLQHEIGGRARVEGAEQRVLVAPADGFIRLAHVRPGDRVRAGQALVDLLEGDLRLESERWASQLAQHENAYAGAMAKSDRTAAATSLARITEAQAQLALVSDQLSRGRVTAPFDAMVIQGDLSQSIGAPVQQGDTLITLATTGRHRVIIEVDEVDIGRVQVGQAGSLSLSSLPWGGLDIVVERITPLAKAVEGRNVFEVEARLIDPRADIRPGLLGRAELVVGRKPVLWAWTGQALDRVRLAWWAWLG